jgi:hypothetical protein
LPDSRAGHAAGLGDGAEQRALGAGRGAGGPVEIRRLPSVPQPGLQRGEGADARLVGIGPDSDRLARAMLA